MGWENGKPYENQHGPSIYMSCWLSNCVIQTFNKDQEFNVMLLKWDPNRTCILTMESLSHALIVPQPAITLLPQLTNYYQITDSNIASKNGRKNE